MKRNNLVEGMRFLFSLLVVGYHVQASLNDGTSHWFANGAVAVEFFFLLSGFLFARTIEKAHLRSESILPATGHMMHGKIAGILPAHIGANLLMILVLIAFSLSTLPARLLEGIPGLFLVQMAAVWDNSYELALVVPEWYLSAMLLGMLLMFPLGLLLRKKWKGMTATLVSLGIFMTAGVGAAVLLHGVPKNLEQDLRALSELHLGIIAYYLVEKIKVKKILPKRKWKVMELCGYLLPVILGVLPLPSSLQPVCMIVTVLGTLVALIITFAGLGTHFSNERFNNCFGFLGSISLLIYLFHPAVVDLVNYALPDLGMIGRMGLVFAATMLMTIAWDLVTKRRKKKGT